MNPSLPVFPNQSLLLSLLLELMLSSCWQWFDERSQRVDDRRDVSNSADTVIACLLEEQ